MEHGVKFKGLSGDSVHLINNSIVKKSRNYKERLRLSFNKQVYAYESYHFSPFKVCRPLEYREGEADSFFMEFIDGQSLWDKDLNSRDREIIEKYFSKEWEDTGRDFLILVEWIVSRFPCSKMTVELLDHLKLTPSVYPRGLCHGDMGLANIISKDNELYLIDFTDSLINTPLMDAACLVSTLLMSDSKEKKDFGNDILNLLSDYKYQIKTLIKLRALQFYRDKNSEEHNKFLWKLFYL